MAIYSGTVHCSRMDQRLCPFTIVPSCLFGLVYFYVHRCIVFDTIVVIFFTFYVSKLSKIILNHQTNSWALHFCATFLHNLVYLIMLLSV